MNSSPFDFHQGQAVMRLAATYPTLLEVVLETIQNAIDKAAKLVTVDVNFRTRCIAVKDNGVGATQGEFEEALQTVCVSKKTRDKLGRFGLGLISPLGKCERFSFVSTPRTNAHDFREWTFVSAEIEKQAKIPGIPMKTRPDLWYCTTDKMKGGVPWRTQVHIEHFTKDRFISRLSMESIRDGILEKYSEAMRRRGSAVSIIFTDEQGNRRTTEVRPKDYEGEKLPEWTFTDRDSGTTCVRLYLAKATARGREGKVKVGESGNDFRIGFSMFHRNLPSGCKLADEVVSALTSGIFEGEILSGKAKFTANRHAFETSDALIGFASAIESWFQESGTQHYRLAVEAKREERYQDIGLSSMRVLDGLLADNAGIPLSEVIASFKRGTIGEGHFDRPGRDSTPPAMSVEGGRTGNDGGREGVRGDPRKEHEGHRPLTVQGPKGKPRRIVCHGSLGLQLTHEALESERLFILDTQDGVLTINTRHPDWVRVEEEGTPTSLGRFEEFILMTSLEIAALPEDFRDVASLAIERMITAYAFLAAHADRIAGRMPGRKPGSSVVPVDQPPKVMKKAAGS